MKCRDVERYVHERLDGKTAALPPEGDRHLSLCPSCRNLLHAASLLEVGLKATALPYPAPLLAARIVGAVQAQRRRHYFHRYRLAVAVAAAVALISLPLVGFLLPRAAPPPRDTASKRLAKSDGKRSEPKQETAKPSLRSKVEKAGTAVASLTDRLAGQTRVLFQAAAPLGDPMASLPDPSDMGGALNPVEQSLRETGSGVSTGLQTVANSTQRAFRFFLREVPDLARNPKTVQ